MRALILAFATTALLAACAPAPVDNDASTSNPGDNGGPTPVTVPSNGPSQCRADQYQRYVGRNRSELPPKPANETWRVTCTTCAVTDDHVPQRLNISFNQQTQIVERIYCG